MNVSIDNQDLVNANKLQRGIASMQADLPNRSAVMNAVQECWSIYPAADYQRRVRLGNRAKLMTICSVVVLAAGHTLWANSPLPSVPPVTADNSSSTLAQWLNADTKLMVPRSSTPWWLLVHGKNGLSIKDAADGRPMPAQLLRTSNSISRFVADNRQFYQLVDNSLQQPWRPPVPGSVEVEPQGQPFWIVSNNLGRPYRGELVVSTGEGLMMPNPTFGHALKGGSKLDPQTEIEQVEPFLNRALWARTYVAAKNGKYDVAAADALQRVRLIVYSLNAPRNGIGNYGVITVVRALRDLVALAPKVSSRDFYKLINGLTRIDNSIPALKVLMMADMANNRYRLQRYLSQNVLTPMMIWRSNSRNSYSESLSGAVEKISLPQRILQSLVLSKNRILADYDYNMSVLARSEGPADIPLFPRTIGGQSTNLKFRRSDPIAIEAYDPNCGALLQNDIDGMHHWIRSAVLSLKASAYITKTGKVPSWLKSMYPQASPATFNARLIPFFGGIPRFSSQRFMHVESPLPGRYNRSLGEHHLTIRRRGSRAVRSEALRPSPAPSSSKGGSR